MVAKSTSFPPVWLADLVIRGWRRWPRDPQEWYHVGRLEGLWFGLFAGIGAGTILTTWGALVAHWLM